jgi:hypothetical protein
VPSKRANRIAQVLATESASVREYMPNHPDTTTTTTDPGTLTLLFLGAVFTVLVARFLSSFLSRISPPAAAMSAPPPSQEAGAAAAPVSVGELTLEELRQYDGSDTSKPLLLVRDITRGSRNGLDVHVETPRRASWTRGGLGKASKGADTQGLDSSLRALRPQACLGNIYDVTRGGDFYGPEGPYNKFAGRCV